MGNINANHVLIKRYCTNIAIVNTIAKPMIRRWPTCSHSLHY